MRKGYGEPNVNLGLLIRLENLVHKILDLSFKLCGNCLICFLNPQRVGCLFIVENSVFIYIVNVPALYSNCLVAKLLETWTLETCFLTI